MRMTSTVCVLVLATLMALPTSAIHAAPPEQTAVANAPQTSIKSLLEADQADRSNGAFQREPEAVIARDSQRRDAAIAKLRAGELRTAEDYFAAAIIFQHSAKDIGLAHALATVASTLDADNPHYRWLIAAAWDRELMQHLQPQWYGTQYQGSNEGMFLFPVAVGAVTDAERTAMGVPTLAEARARVGEMAKMMGEKARTDAPNIDMLRETARRENSAAAAPAAAPQDK